MTGILSFFSRFLTRSILHLTLGNILNRQFLLILFLLFVLCCRSFRLVVVLLSQIRILVNKIGISLVSTRFHVFLKSGLTIFVTQLFYVLLLVALGFPVNIILPLLPNLLHALFRHHSHCFFPLSRKFCILTRSQSLGRHSSIHL